MACWKRCSASRCFPFIASASPSLVRRAASNGSEFLALSARVRSVAAAGSRPCDSRSSAAFRYVRTSSLVFAVSAARFHDSLSQLFSTISQSHPFFIRCLKPNSDKCPMKFDMPVVLEQLRYTGLLETIRIRKLGYPIRYKYNRFVQKYRCLLGARVPRGAPTKEVARVILDR